MFFHIFIRVIYMLIPEGVSLATMQPMNGSSPRMAAINNQADSNNYQNNLINAIGGRGRKSCSCSRRGRKSCSCSRRGRKSCSCSRRGRKTCSCSRRRRRKTYKGGFPYPQNKPLYSECGGAGQTTVDVTNKLAVTQSQNSANGVFDKNALQGGRSRRRRTKSRGGGRNSRRR